MSGMKRFAEQVSVEMGLEGEITDDVLAEAQRRLDSPKMYALVTDQGTAAYETALCEVCYMDEANQGYAREQASQTDDVDPEGDFQDCSQNDALACCICGYPEVSEPDAE